MSTVKQYRRQLKERYGCVPGDALEKLVLRERKIRWNINEELKKVRREIRKQYEK